MGKSRGALTAELRFITVAAVDGDVVYYDFWCSLNGWLHSIRIIGDATYPRAYCNNAV